MTSCSCSLQSPWRRDSRKWGWLYRVLHTDFRYVIYVFIGIPWHCIRSCLGISWAFNGIWWFFFVMSFPPKIESGNFCFFWRRSYGKCIDKMHENGGIMWKSSSQTGFYRSILGYKNVQSIILNWWFQCFWWIPMNPDESRSDELKP